MKIQIKQHLIQEGILQGIKDNWGKMLIAAGGLAAANAGVFGKEVQSMVQAGGSRLEQFTKDAGDWSKEAIEKLNKKYGVDANGDGIKTMAEAGQKKIEDASSASSSSSENSENEGIFSKMFEDNV